MSRGTLIRLLLVLLALEIALAAGWYLTSNTNTAKAPAASPTSTPAATAVASPVSAQKVCTKAGDLIQNSPRTVITGHTETFSACLPGYAGVTVTYSVKYSDGSGSSYKVKVDKTGYSKRTLLIKHLPKTGRDSVTISVAYGTKVHLRTQFAVQAPGYGGH
jgi:hypothetical protein